ncbi:MAG: hypothetical protein EOO63_16990 [Hymenobacter sp.]|nr:MAG: hypothetical protein EOO63_16990 [Hymenobacter sp.]
MRGPKLVADFNSLLLRCQEAAALYHSVAEDDTESDAAGYTRLFELLAKIVLGRKIPPQLRKLIKQ